MSATILPFVPRRRPVRAEHPTNCGFTPSGVPVHVWTATDKLGDRCRCGEHVLDLVGNPPGISDIG